MDEQTEEHLKNGLYEYTQELCLIEAMAKAQFIMIQKKLPPAYQKDIADNAEVICTLLEYCKTKISELNKQVFQTEVTTLKDLKHSSVNSLRIS